MFDLFSAPLQDEEAARELMERLRWPVGVVCPRCNRRESVYELNGRSVRPGLYKCGACDKQFSVTIETAFHGTKVPLNKWLMAIYLLSGCHKGITNQQLADMLGISYKSAWHMADRLYEIMGSFDFQGQFNHIVKSKETEAEADSRDDPGVVWRDGKLFIKKTPFWEL
ncbi:IS1595 family transposase [Thiohalophilus sp.]|uniref:IS1595 family transposase n=1 Tax=Thiohalophilus sp. TaxID=3028392 RepID=UPI002ACDC1B2|nr:IS1595 family transposase [Thiohalophilus sp.]MDZ7660922.1 IS1595 family transposase [Thiohalophilus sp.]